MIIDIKYTKFRHAESKSILNKRRNNRFEIVFSFAAAITGSDNRKKNKKQITNQQFIKLALDNSRSLARHDDALVSDGSESIKREQQKKKWKKTSEAK